MPKVSAHLPTHNHSSRTMHNSRLSYDPTNPLVVSLTIRTGEENWVTWELSRELLADAFMNPAGIADVRMWIDDATTWEGDPLGKQFFLRLTSPSGSCELGFHPEQVWEFLMATAKALPLCKRQGQCKARCRECAAVQGLIQAGLDRLTIEGK